MQPQPPLPLEVLDYILSFLHSDRRSLQRCTGVNHVFATIAERYLFHKIRVVLSRYGPTTPTNDIEDPERMLKLITARPRLAAHVKVLTLYISVDSSETFVKRRMDEDCIGQLLYRFHQINIFSLTGKLVWHRLHRTFRNAFAQMLERDSLQKLFLSGIEGFPFPLLDHCHSLKHLFLEKMKRVPIPYEDQLIRPPTNNKRAELASLNVEGLDLNLDNDDRTNHNYSLPLISDWLQSPHSPQIQNLSSIFVGLPRPQDVRHVQALLDSCSSHLKEVSISFNEAGQ